MYKIDPTDGLEETQLIIWKQFSMVIDTELLDRVSEQAKESPRLRMNYNFLRPSE